MHKWRMSRRAEEWSWEDQFYITFDFIAAWLATHSLSLALAFSLDTVHFNFQHILLCIFFFEFVCVCVLFPPALHSIFFPFFCQTCNKMAKWIFTTNYITNKFKIQTLKWLIFAHIHTLLVPVIPPIHSVYVLYVCRFSFFILFFRFDVRNFSASTHFMCNSNTHIHR